MEQKNRPYRGMQAEIAERESRTARHIAQLENNDSVIAAAKACLIIGTAGSLILIGFPFFVAAFALGVYAMATHRVKQGVVISILATVIPFGVMILLQLLWLGMLASAFKAGFPSTPTPLPL